MRQLCAWCEKEGKVGLLGEKEPLEDPTETHGVCDTHKQEFLDTLRAGSALGAAG